MTGSVDGDGAGSMLFDAPGDRQGWGRVMLDDALYFAGDSRKLFLLDIPAASGLADDTSTYYTVDVTSTSSPLKLTLVWTDPPPAAGAGKLLVNDLDLIVTAPNGAVYKGNQWTADNVNVSGDKESALNPAGRDSTNNVEGVLIKVPMVGQYRIEIKGTDVPGTPEGVTPAFSTQGFAFVVTGAFTGGAATGTPPTVWSVTPKFGLNNNPTTMTIAGDLFQATPQAYLGTQVEPQRYPLTGETFLSSTLMQATVPVNLANGIYQLKIVNPDGSYAFLMNAFTVAAPVQGPAPTMFITGSNPNVNAADQLAMINLAQGTALPPVALTTLDDPNDVAVNRTMGRGVVSMGSAGQSGRVGIMSLNPAQIVTTIDVPNAGAPQQRKPRAVAIHPSGNPAYVLTWKSSFPSDQQLSALDLNTMIYSIGPVTLGNVLNPTDLAVSPDGQRIYVTNSDDDTLSVIRTSDLYQSALVPVGDSPVGVAVSPNSSRAYVVNMLSSTISVVDTTLPVPATISTIDVKYQGNNTEPLHAVVSPDGTKLYVTFNTGAYHLATVTLATGAISWISTNDSFWKVDYVPSLAKLFALQVAPGLKRLNPGNLQVDWSVDHGANALGMDWVEPAPPTITSVAPNTACKTAYTSVTITGSSFQGEVWNGTTFEQAHTQVFFGGVEAAYVFLTDSTHLTAVAPPHAQGYVNVEVRNPNGLSATLTNGLRYITLCQQ